jgi:hypothetical protein
MDSEKHRVSDNDARFGCQCEQCGYPFDPGDLAHKFPDDPSGPFYCSKRCLEDWADDWNERQSRLAHFGGMGGAPGG